MGDLILNSLEIQNFRAFRHLRIERLGRVNLLVGKNSVGKTAVLEALRVYANRGWPATIWEILVERDESQYWLPSSERTDSKERAGDIRYLFYGRREILERSEEVQIGPIGVLEKTVSIDVAWYASRVEGRESGEILPAGILEDGAFREPVLGIRSQVGTLVTYFHSIERYTNRSRPLLIRSVGIPCFFVSTAGIDRRTIDELWNRVALTPQEEQVVAALRLITADIERLNVVGNRLGRSPIVKVAGSDSPLPLKSLGEGLYRIFGIALALVNARDGFLLVDEIESGLHYTALLDLWRLILQTARHLNVQVFATTHAWDCIEAFQQATREDQREEGILIRLGRRQDDIVATVFDEEELAIATRERIEVR